MPGILHLSKNKRKKLVMSSILSSFVLVMSLMQPWAHRTEILGSIIIPELDSSIVLKDPTVAKTFLRKKNASKVRVLVNRKLIDQPTLADIGLTITSPELARIDSKLAFFENFLAQTFSPEEEKAITAELKLDHTAFNDYVENLFEEIEVEAVKPQVTWSENRGWHFRGMKKGVTLDEKSIERALPQLIDALQKGEENPKLKLATKKVRPQMTEEERERNVLQIDAVHTLVDIPVTIKIKDEIRTLDLNAAPDYITLTDEGAEMNGEKIQEWINALEQEMVKPGGFIRITEKTEIRPGVFKAVTEGEYTMGETIRADEVYEMIKTALGTDKRDIKVALHDVPFSVYSDLEQTDYELLSTGWSEFSTGNHKERVHNFTTGLKRVSGTLIDRGQTISFNNALGKMNDEFVKGLGITGSVATPVLGGGICQASTTFFRALVNLGVPLKMHKNHSWDLSYYRKGGYGLDATIFPEQGLDVKALNDIDSQLFIYAYVKPETTEAFVLVYGKSDGRSVSLTPAKDYHFAPGPKTIIWNQVVTLSNGDVREHDIVSKYNK